MFLLLSKDSVLTIMIAPPQGRVLQEDGKSEANRAEESVGTAGKSQLEGNEKASNRHPVYWKQTSDYCLVIERPDLQQIESQWLCQLS